MSPRPVIEVPATIQRETFVIDQDLINRGYLILGRGAALESVDFQIGDQEFFVYGRQYLVKVVTSGNDSLFPEASVDDTIISWRESDLGSGLGLEALINSLVGSIIEVKYVVSDYTETVEEVPTTATDVDGVDWDGKYIMVFLAGNNGSIDPFGSFFVDEGSDVTVTMTPDLNYHVSDVLVNGESIGPVNEYTFENIQDHIRLEVLFSIDEYLLEVL